MIASTSTLILVSAFRNLQSMTLFIPFTHTLEKLFPLLTLALVLSALVSKLPCKEIPQSHQPRRRRKRDAEIPALIVSTTLVHYERPIQEIPSVKKLKGKHVKNCFPLISSLHNMMVLIHPKSDFPRVDFRIIDKIFLRHQ